MGARREGREMALQALYLSDVCGLQIPSALKAALKQEFPETVKEFSRHLVKGVIENKEEIDRILRLYAENWELNRMASVDRNILRLSAFEILSDVETPVSVIIDEAIEIAKTYSTGDSGKFVNGILDKVKKERKESRKP